MCIFAKQNIVKDPPFSKIDLISCRNVLIYFGPELQKKAVRILFYALSTKGFLMIGPSETVGEFAGLFSVADKKNTIYAKKADLSKQYFEAPVVEYGKEKAADKSAEGQPAGVFNIQKEADNIVLAEYSPAGFVVNEAMTVLQFRGNTGPYLMPASGETSLNLLKMVSEDLVGELRTLLHQAKEEDAPVKKKRARVERGKLIRYINVDVVPFKAPVSGERYFLVLLEEIGYHPRPRTGPVTEDAVRLGQELAATKMHLHTVTREYEAANEELRALNEELQSGNEEMQSINEEMETAKEELQSTNEELTTVNDELQSRNEETMRLNNDLVNVLRGVEIPIIILGNELQIRRFNDAAARLLNLIPTDAERPLSHIRTNINIPDLEQMVLDATNTLAVKEKEVQDMEGRWYSVTIRPYKTVDNRIDGILMTLVDINAIKISLLRVKEAYDYANDIVETVREPLLILDAGLRVITANRSFYENFMVDPEETEGRYMYELGNGQWNIPGLMKQLKGVLPQQKSFSDFEVVIDDPDTGRKTVLLNAREIRKEVSPLPPVSLWEKEYDGMILLAIEDTTERKKIEEDLKELNRALQVTSSELEVAYQDMESFSYSVSHDLRAPLRIIEGMSNIVLKGYHDKLDDTGKDLLNMIHKNTKKMDQLVLALLELSKIGRQEISIDEIDMEKEAALAAADLKAAAAERNITMTIQNLPPAHGDIVLIRQVLTNLLSNAVKITKNRDVASIEVGGRRENSQNVYYVKDNGAGFDTKSADKLFKVFQRMHSLKEFEGIGIGLSIVDRIIRRHGGHVWAEGTPDKGATFYFTLPRVS